MDLTHLPPPARLMSMVMGSWVAQAVGTAARLNLADALVDGPRTAEEVAQTCGANQDATFRLLRALSSLGVFSMTEGRFALTPLGETLRSNVPGSMRNIAIAETDTAHWLTWGKFTDAVKEGRMMTEEALGSPPWEYYGKHPRDGEQFSRAMVDISHLAIGPVLATYDFSFANSIADIGGAHGALLAAMLAKKTDARGILFDLPQVAETAKGAMHKAGLAGRVEVVGGDFLKQVPAGADLYLLKHVLHDWDDEHAIQILKSVRAAMGPKSRLLVVEFALPDDASPSPAHLMDLNMLVMVNGRERTPNEYATLFSKAGLKMNRFIPTPSPMGLVEGVVA